MRLPATELRVHGPSVMLRSPWGCGTGTSPPAASSLAAASSPTTAAAANIAREWLLNARSDVDRLAEVVPALVQRDGKAQGCP